MTWPAFSAAILSRLLGSNSRAFGRLARIFGASGPVQPMFRTRRQGGAQLSERERLAREYRTARRQHRPSKAICSKAKAVTHSILARGQHGRA